MNIIEIKYLLLTNHNLLIDMNLLIDILKMDKLKLYLMIHLMFSIMRYLIYLIALKLMTI
jgi:plasmid replication initiation protein